MKNWTRHYYFFCVSKTTYNKIKKDIKLDYIWDELRGPGYGATLELSPQEVQNLKVKLWGLKYQLQRIKGE